MVWAVFIGEYPLKTNLWILQRMLERCDQETLRGAHLARTFVLTQQSISGIPKRIRPSPRCFPMPDSITIPCAPDCRVIR